MTKAPKKQSDDNTRSHAETVRIRENTLKKLLSTPPKQHKDMIAERKAKRGKDAKK